MSQSVLDSKGWCRHICCFNLTPVARVVHHLDRCFGGRICPTDFHISQADRASSCTLSSKHQHSPYKTSFCFFKTTSDFCCLHSGIPVMTLIHIHLLPFWLPIASADTPRSLCRLCPVLCSFCLFAISYSLPGCCLRLKQSTPFHISLVHPMTSFPLLQLLIFFLQFSLSSLSTSYHCLRTAQCLSFLLNRPVLLKQLG